MKKIGLMTWHHAENYGTAYQAYALKTIIEHLGYKVYLIDYRRLNKSPMRVPNIYAVVLSKLISICRKACQKNKHVFRFRKNTFENFYAQHFIYSQECHFNQDFVKLNEEYDGFVCGSDQIWSPEWYDSRFFLDFVVDKRKKIAYAPSIGVSKIRDHEIGYLIKDQIIRFQHLSLRERNGCEVVKQLTGRQDVHNVLDPVIMLDFNYWQKIEEPFNYNGRYALIFFLANNPKNIRLSIEAAKNKGLHPLVLHSTQTYDNSFVNTDELTPGQMLSCIRHADYIFTDSFHVAVLSIIFHRQFITFKKQTGRQCLTQFGRIIDLLDKLQIKGGIYYNLSSFDETIDYSNVDKLLILEREKSLKYLTSALSSLPDSSSITSFNCNIKSICDGECTKAFKDYISTVNNVCQKDFMISCQFSLETKCYRCKNLKYSILQEGRMPLFYNKLQKDLGNKKKDVYRKYYQSFYILNLLKKL